MAEAKDLTGQRFGRLTALRLADEPYISQSGKKTRRWVCRCDCGSEIIVLQNALTRKNGTRSCGCARSEAARKLGRDFAGQRFGRLTVIRETDLEKPEANGNKRGWLCRCDCGNEVVVSSKNLLTGLKSCGCLLSETAKKKIEEQNTVGHYKGTTVSAIKKTRKINSNNQSGTKGVYWSEPDGCWIAKIGFQGRRIYLGRFSKLEDAAQARREAEEKYYSPIIDEYEKTERAGD